VTLSPNVRIVEVDPQGADAMALLTEAAVEARGLYPELHGPNSAWPTNPPTPAGGVYLVAYLAGCPLACGALRPIDAATAEVRRMFVSANARRAGLATRILRALENHASRLGYSLLKLQTGDRQHAAVALYARHGYARIEPFGEHVDDPTSVCFEKPVSQAFAPHDNPAETDENAAQQGRP